MRCTYAKFAASLVLLISFTAFAQSRAGFSTPQVGHDQQRPYRALVMCIDRSRSPLDEQFRKLLVIMEAIAERDVTYNDVVWLIEIQSTLEPVQIFPMPAASSRRSDGTAAADGLRESKAALIAAIRRMSQVSDATDVRSSVEAGLDILRSHAEATVRVIVIGSDFVSDAGIGRASLIPPTARRNGYATGVNVLLLVTYPKPAYLQKIRISHSELLASIEAKWTAYFKEENASNVTVNLVDAIPLAVQTATTVEGK
jgi:hypothetical protein